MASAAESAISVETTVATAATISEVSSALVSAVLASAEAYHLTENSVQTPVILLALKE
jgi:hypothetical protein